MLLAIICLLGLTIFQSECFIRSLKPIFLGSKLSIRTSNNNLDDLQSELLDALSSLNPFKRMKVDVLREMISQEEKKIRAKIVEEETRRAEEARRAEDARREEETRRAEETKTVRILYSEFTGQEPTLMTRRAFDAYYLHSDKRLVVYNESYLPSKYCKVQSFDHLIDFELYYVEYLNSETNFCGYSKVEGNIQTHDCVQSILSGNVYIEPFSSQDTEVYYEFNVNPPVSGNFKNYSFKFPIRPDALLVHGDEWLFLECKHRCKVRDELVFNEKIEFIRSHLDEKWVTKGLSTPRTVQGAVCSVETFTEPEVTDLLRFVRIEQGYKIFNNTKVDFE